MKFKGMVKYGRVRDGIPCAQIEQNMYTSGGTFRPLEWRSPGQSGCQIGSKNDLRLFEIRPFASRSKAFLYLLHNWWSLDVGWISVIARNPPKGKVDYALSR